MQAKLGITAARAFDVQAVCSGFVFALAVADNFIKAGQAQTVLVIGAETFSRILDWKDRGDLRAVRRRRRRAGAARLTRRGRQRQRRAAGILSTHLHSDGRYRDILYVDGGPSSTRTVGHLRMSGKEVFRHAVASLDVGRRGGAGGQRP